MLKSLHKKFNASAERIAIFSIVGLIFQSGIIYLVTMLWAKWLGPEGYGEYSHLWSSILIAASFASFGMPLLLQRELPRQSAEERKKLITVVFITLPFLLVITSMFVLAVNSLNTNITYGFGRGTILILASLFYLVFTILEAVFKGMSLYSEIDLLKKYLFPAALLTGTVLFSFAFERASFEDYIYLRLLCMFLIMFLLVTRHIEILPIDFNVTKKDIFSLLSISRNFFIGSSVILLGGELSIYFSGFYLEPSVLGAYSLGVRIATIVNMALIGANVPAMQTISKLAHQEKYSDMEISAKKTARLAFFGAILLYCIGLFSIDILLYIFDLSFDEKIIFNTVACVGGAYLFSAFLGPAGVVLNMSGREKYANFSAILSLIIMVVILILFSSQFGYLSVVLAFSFNIIVWKLSMTLIVRKLYKFWTTVI